MNRIRIDRKKNRLYLSVSSCGRAEMMFLGRILANACRDLRPGFSCMVDISAAGRLDGMKDDRMVGVMVLLWRCGMGEVVRVRESRRMPGHFHLEKACLSTGYTEKRVGSLSEAEAFLEMAAGGEPFARSMEG